jgi:hypothetical protein
MGTPSEPITQQMHAASSRLPLPTADTNSTHAHFLKLEMKIKPLDITVTRNHVADTFINIATLKLFIP